MAPRELSDQLLPPSSVAVRLYFRTKSLDDLPCQDGSNRVAFVVHPLGDESRAWTLCCSARAEGYAKPIITVERRGTKLFGTFIPNPDGSYWQRIV